MFRLLGLHPGPDISAAAAASLVADEHGARRLLAELTRAHLVAEHVPGRYALHDLVRAYAADQARDTDSQPERTAAVGRVLDHYLHSARNGAVLVQPSLGPVALSPPSPGTAPEQFTRHEQALAWFDAEYDVLLATVDLAMDWGWHPLVWQISWVSTPFLAMRARSLEWSAIKRVTMAAGNRDEAVVVASGAREAAGTLGDHQHVLDYFANSRKLYQQLGSRRGEALALFGLASIAEYLGQYGQALSHAEEAAGLFHELGDQASEAELLNATGWYHALLGDYQQAGRLCRQALALSIGDSSRHLEGNIWNSLGYAEYHAGDFAEAAACAERALSIFRAVGDRWGEVDTLTNLGDICHAAGDRLRAREAWQQALDILNDLQHPDAAKVRAKLARR
jgi:tetratricopeptide (TPR) repeat protein